MKRTITWMLIVWAIPLFAQYQMVIDTEYPWYTNILKYKVPSMSGGNIITSLGYEILPINEDVDFTKQVVFLDENRLRSELPAAVNRMRVEYERKEIKHNHKICERIAYCYENGLPEEYPSTYSDLMPEYYGNIVMHFKDRERAICDMYMDFATLTSDDFFAMTDPNAKEFGYYLKKDSDDYYHFIIVIK